MKTEPLFNEAGEMTGLEIYWLFGDFYSAFIMEEIPKDADGTPNAEALRELAAGNLTNLAEYNYYTKITKDGEDQAFTLHPKFTTGITDYRLWMKYQIDLKTPLDPVQDGIRYSVYDPTYYIEILHDDKAPSTLLPASQRDRCKSTLIPPNPPEEMSIMAYSLDRTEKPNFNLGDYFAEWVKLSCK